MVPAQREIWLSDPDGYLVVLAGGVKRVLRQLDYYADPMDGTWSANAEKALADFVWNNCYFEKPTVVVDGVRRIDGMLVNLMRYTDPEALAPATPAAQ